MTDASAWDCDLSISAQDRATQAVLQTLRANGCWFCRVTEGPEPVGGIVKSEQMEGVDMVMKLLEIRDIATFIPALAIQVSGTDGYLMRRAGFESPMIYLIALATERCCYDPYNWGDRTMNTAHQYIEKEWDVLKDGDVVDVEFILGETSTPKCSERVLALSAEA